MIDLTHVVKTFETAAGQFRALDDVTVRVKVGELVAVVGKSGSGKSTMLNMIAGIDRPTSGDVVVAGTAVHAVSEGNLAAWRGRTLGIVFQFFQLMPTLNVLENVMLPMDFARSYPRDQRPRKARALLEQVGMVEHADKLPSALSGGEQQRVAIARALANDPPVLLADEPTGNLDTQTADAVLRLFVRLVRGGKTIVIVTHDSDIAARADRMVTLSDGHVVDALLNQGQDGRRGGGEAEPGEVSEVTDGVGEHPSDVGQ
jgi:ABC-type lipoprotein export system ATPase subunit